MTCCRCGQPDEERDAGGVGGRGVRGGQQPLRQVPHQHQLGARVRSHHPHRGPAQRLPHLHSHL